MPKQIKSIEELRRELAVREAQLAPLQSKRNKIAKRLARIDGRIAALTGEAAPARGRKPRKGKRGKKAASATQKGKRGRPVKKQVNRAGRRVGEKPLSEYVVQILKKAKDGIKTKDIVSAVQRAGYKSASKNFYVVVNVLLNKDKRFQKVGPGLFKLA